MDAQNATQSDQTKPAGASPSYSLSGPELETKAAAPSGLTAPSPLRERRPRSGDGADNAVVVAPLAARPDNMPAVAERDSDAETIVLPGKDDHSPSKVRKVRHEDGNESDGELARPRRKSDESDSQTAPAGSQPADAIGEKHTAHPGGDNPRRLRVKEGLSSGLSSAPESPPSSNQQQHQYQQQHPLQHRRRRSDAAHSSPSDAEQSIHQKAFSTKSSLRDKLKLAERLVPHKRKALNIESDDEADIRKARRQRTSSVHLDGQRPPKDIKSTPAKPPSDSCARSISPQPRQHRRSISSNLPSQSNGLGAQKKRLPPPLQSTEYHSDDSSAGGSPHLRSSKLRSLATPTTADSTISPAKMVPHKKHLDAHGQTLLARACARGEYDTAKQRLAERPEDLNVADYAGNTPLQIASLHGCEDIVKLLIEVGSNLDCVNYDKDTPLLDAVDNGHIGVVRLLLDAGVNPRKANVNGQEPLDRVGDETNNADEIRAALVAARKRAGERHQTSEDRQSHPDHQDVRDSHAPDSPRRSPPITASTTTGRRSGTVRSTKTRNDLLYMPLDDKTLRQAAGRGDKETVARILQVKEAFDDPESMVAAARGGHDLVIQLLLGLGGANPDPAPVPSRSSDFATPILAAIGQENIKVIELLLEQQGFDPTRRFKEDTYYEIARRRQGTNWKEEEQMLKNAYDDYKRAHKDSLKTKSPKGRRERERDRDEKLLRRDDIRDLPRTHKHIYDTSSHEDDIPKKRHTGPKITSPRERKRSYPPPIRSGDEAQTRAPARVKKDITLTSDRDISPVPPSKPPKSKRAESDLTGLSSEGETAKPRRKLVSKGELSRERDQKRAIQEPTSPREPKPDDATDKPKMTEKYHDRTKALKRDETRDSSSGDLAVKRQRTSTTPDRPSDADKDHVEGLMKRRRLDAETQAVRRPNRPSVDGRVRKPASSRDRVTKTVLAGSRKERDEGIKDGYDQRKKSLHGLGRSNSNADDKSIHVKWEAVELPMHDVGPPGEADNKPDFATIEQAQEEFSRRKELADEEAAKREEQRRLEAEEKKRQNEEESRRKREEEKARRAEEEERKKREEEEAQRRQELADRERREVEGTARRQAEEKKRLEEAKRQEEKKRRREEEKRWREEEEQKRREEEERLRKERLAREAADAARRQREEERKERERRDRAYREEIERKRAAREAEQKRIREEQEHVRLDKLPPLLRWLGICPNPKSPVIAEKFRRMVGARYDTIRQEANGTPAGREQWVLNTHVALILGEKDLDLSRYTAWEREPVSDLAKLTIWRTEWACYALLSDKVWDLGRQLPGYYGVEDPSEMGHDTRQRLKAAAWDKFLALNMFFVKVSDLMYTVSNIPHLRNIRLAVEYRELLETESQLVRWQSSSKWKQDPGVERFFGFSPRNTYYVNGVFAGEDIPKLSETSKTPFPEVRVPRRGLVRAFPEDPDYERLCIEQGLEHLLQTPQTPVIPNGVHSSPQNPRVALVNGKSGPVCHDTTDEEATTNGETLSGVVGF